jgi:hypothetical protein
MPPDDSRPLKGFRSHVRAVASDQTPTGIPCLVRLHVTFRSPLRYKGSEKMATALCQKCKQAHPGRVCDYDDKAECAETIPVDEVAQAHNEPSKDDED